MKDLPSIINSFWKTVKAFLSDKIVGKNKIHSTENGELIKTDLNDFFFFKYSTKS